MEAVMENVKVEKYSEYKNSGAEWIGELPRHWKVLRLKYICSVNQKSLPENTDKNFSFDYVDIGSVTLEEGVTQIEKFIFKDAPSRARRRATEGDTIISTVRTYLKAIDYIDSIKSNYIYSTGFAVLSPNKIASKFLTFAVKSDSFTNQVDAFSTGMSYPAINSTDLGRLSIPIPPKEEQTRIAQFLDLKTSQIDQAITQKEKLIELLKERRQILIYKTLTQGLNTKTCFKSSAIESLGKIPEHWRETKLKYLLIERNERSENGEEPLFMVSQIYGLVVRSEYHEKYEVAQSAVGNKKVYKNDLVFNKLKAHLGVFFKSNIGSVGIVSPDYAVYTACGDIQDLKYLELLFRHPVYIAMFITKATGIVEGLIRLYTSDLFSLKVPVPPPDEQASILEFITNVSSKFDSTIKYQEDQIEKLKEYKATLINSAVTGKIKV